MEIKNILKEIKFTFVSEVFEGDIRKIEYNSKKVTTDDMFFCIKGLKVDGHLYIDEAIKKGAKVIVLENTDFDPKVKGITVIKVADTRKALAKAAANYYNNPSKKINLIGITGTNGKTTTSYMIKSILEEAGYKVGLIGTIANFIGKTPIPSERTTPESLELQCLLSEMVKEGTDYCVMEVSSHSLALDRVYGIKFKSSMFTNLTQDHLDFHKTFENYYNCKLKLFKNSEYATINVDDSYGKRVLSDIKKENIIKNTYSIIAESDFKAYNIKSYLKEISFNMDFQNTEYDMKISIPGNYNIYNALGAISICVKSGIDMKCIQKGLERSIVPGRCETVAKDKDLEFDIILDYAHTPDGLENVLSTLKDLTKGRLISVYGCGGDRDKGKRSIMGSIGERLSDITIITSDNPRSEDPINIIQDIMLGIKDKENCIVIEDRKKAIEKAIYIAKKDDVILIAGKGHETYQVLKEKTIHFDEREIVEEILNNKFSRK
ncbi:UDP-N-acetylmuramoylalanyl-D-glutamate--2, 6-diaminopimelate ligase [Clostridium putrefaciens]|uniref:UDP-N-acetylmuramoyl-L-alanyl-D-glutamate--2,6-diaminopimelate ligase n=1 Tax=Clostridium putrefaciens TaxID=99675 RepID=A0A381J8A2_9CLOT|nr:UDP-N-acetylmuramoyl-L-alanyl-D-glutamate--2,6-diaminopimelate ligase [Clostridium putrefaciens]SUY47229.1 UDP-N-acetylmuramoylalanyl-D-glutamate--2, 6-diaminopimelate ligase [Clostridium putrefaciens]